MNCALRTILLKSALFAAIMGGVVLQGLGVPRALAATHIDLNDRWAAWRAFWDDPRDYTDALDKALQSTDSEKDPQTWLRLFSSNCLLRMDDMGLQPSIAEDLDRALRIAVAYQRLEDQARILTCRGLLAFNNANTGAPSRSPSLQVDPAPYFEQALELEQRHELVDEYVFTITMYYEFLNTSGKKERMVQLVGEGLALILNGRVKDPSLRANMQMTAADVFRDQGQLERSVALFQEVEKECLAAQLRALCIDNYLAYAEMHLSFLKPKDVSQAITILSKAERLSYEIEDAWGRNLISYKKSTIFLEMKRYAEAKDFGRKAAEFFQGKAFRLHILASLNVARSHLKLNEASEAIAILRPLLANTGQEFVQEHITIRRELAAAYEQQHAWRDAFAMRTEQLELEKKYVADLQKEKMAQQMTQLGLQVEEEKSRALQKENELQSRRLREAELEASIRNWAIALVSALSLACLGVVILISKKNRQIESSRQDIRSILDHIQIGIFSISDPVHLRIDPERSRNLEAVIGAKPDQAYDIESILLDQAELDADRVSLIRSCLSASIGDSALTFELNAENLPGELTLNVGGERRIVKLDWNIVTHPQTGVVQRILVSCRDVTMLRTYRETSRHQQKELDLIHELISIPQARFVQFVRSAQVALEESRQLVQGASGASVEAGLRVIFLNLHTMKGAARTLGLTNLSLLIHGAEEALMPVRSGARRLDRDALLHEFRSIQELLDEYRQINREKLNREEGSDENVAIPRSFVRTIMDQLLNRNRLEPRELWTLACAAYVPAARLVEDIQSGLPRLAEDLGRRVPGVEADGLQDVFFSHEAYAVLADCFVHLIRNSMDHGLESAEERLRQGKSAVGTLSFHGEIATFGDFLLEFSDDGRGLSLEHIRRKAASLSLLAEGQTYAPREIAELIFHDGFSTASSVTEMSGRGVGMGAVREYLTRLGGSIEIRILESEVHAYTSFRFLIRVPAAHITRITLDNFDKEVA